MYTKYRAKNINTGDWVYGSLNWINEFFTPTIIPVQVHNEQIVDKNTLGMCINYQDDFDNDIYTGDIVQFDDFETYLVWFCNEMQCLEAVCLNDGELYCNKPRDNASIVECDYHNMQRIVEYAEFCLMLQDPYGDFTGKIKVIGNIFDNPELVKIGE